MHNGNKTFFLLQNPARWLTPKTPPFRIDENVPKLLDDILKYFLPMGLSIEQRESERQSINRFIRELNQIRKNNVDRDFASSYVVSNVSALAESFPFVSFSHHRHAMYPTLAPFVSFAALRFHFKECLKFQLNWVELLPSNWTGPIVIRSPSYMRALRDLLLSHTNRVIQNSLLLLFALNALPPGASTPLICTKATVIEVKKEQQKRHFCYNWQISQQCVN